MATKPYNSFSVITPNITQTRQVLVDGTRGNMLTLYLNAAFTGGIGWQGASYTYDDEGRVLEAIIANITDQARARVAYSYYTSGAALGYCQRAEVSYSEDGGATWAGIGSQYFNYDDAGNLLPTTWVYFTEEN